ncbi:tellurite resistance TerB family protein [Streptomyces sp. NPDC094038]|uniref:tellurite resistance TerB family protein n=1 Tax=Streptomyces sp. NPDC094038 TaxID=3366055 RepID=UPI0038169787
MKGALLSALLSSTALLKLIAVAGSPSGGKAARWKGSRHGPVGPRQGLGVAGADGKIDPSERQRVAQLTFGNEVLQVFPADGLQRRFDGNLDKLTAGFGFGFGFGFGKVSVLREVAKAKKKPAEARAVIQTGIVIGGADDDFDAVERAVVRDACFTLGLPPHGFDL